MTLEIEMPDMVVKNPVLRRLGLMLVLIVIAVRVLIFGALPMEEVDDVVQPGDSGS